VRERPASLLSSTTASFLLEPEDDIPEEFSVLDPRGMGRTAPGRG
jgi:hypothetical protein